MGFIGRDRRAHLVPVGMPIVDRCDPADRARDVIEKLFGYVDRDGQPGHGRAIRTAQIVERVFG